MKLESKSEAILQIKMKRKSEKFVKILQLKNSRGKYFDSWFELQKIFENITS
jgi:hypothetical protein